MAKSTIANRNPVTEGDGRQLAAEASDDAREYLAQAQALVELVRWREESQLWIEIAQSSESVKRVRAAGGLRAPGEVIDAAVPTALYLAFELMDKAQKEVAKMAEAAGAG